MIREFCLFDLSETAVIDTLAAKEEQTLAHGCLCQSDAIYKKDQSDVTCIN